MPTLVLIALFALCCALIASAAFIAHAIEKAGAAAAKAIAEHPRGHVQIFGLGEHSASIVRVSEAIHRVGLALEEANKPIIVNKTVKPKKRKR